MIIEEFLFSIQNPDKQQANAKDQIVGFLLEPGV